MIKRDPESEFWLGIHYLKVAIAFLLIGLIWGYVSQQFEWTKLKSACRSESIDHMEPFDRESVCACAVNKAKKEYSYFEFI